MSNDDPLAKLEERVDHHARVVSILREELRRRDEELRRRGEIIVQLAELPDKSVAAASGSQGRREMLAANVAPHTFTRASIVAAFLPHSQDRLRFRQHLLAIVLAASLIGINLAVNYLARVPLGAISLVMSNAPLIAGYWVGLKWRGTHLWAYLLEGLGVGIVASLCVLGVVTVSRLIGGNANYIIPYSEYGLAGYTIGLVLYALGPFLLYLSGGLLADATVSWVAKQQADPAAEVRPIEGQQARRGVSALTLALIANLIPAVASIVVAVISEYG